LPRPFSKPLRLSRIACGDRRAAARLKGASLTAAAVWNFRRQELDGEARSAAAAPSAARQSGIGAISTKT